MVNEYFDRRASQYLERSHSGLWARVRHRESAAVLKAINPGKGDRILDVGCGPGYYMRQFAAAGSDVVGVDRSFDMLAAAGRAGASVVQADCESAIPLSACFAKALCAGILEFCEDPERALDNVAAVCTPRCDMVVLAPPNTPGGWLYRLFHLLFGCRVSVRLFTRGWLEAYFRSRGFVRVESRSPTPYSLVIRASRA